MKCLYCEPEIVLYSLGSAASQKGELISWTKWQQIKNWQTYSKGY